MSAGKAQAPAHFHPIGCDLHELVAEQAPGIMPSAVATHTTAVRPHTGLDLSRLSQKRGEHGELMLTPSPSPAEVRIIPISRLPVEIASQLTGYVHNPEPALVVRDVEGAVLPRRVPGATFCTRARAGPTRLCRTGAADQSSPTGGYP